MKALHLMRFNGAPLDPVRREAPVSSNGAKLAAVHFEVVEQQAAGLSTDCVVLFRSQATFKKKKNVLLGVSDSLIKVPAVGLSYVVDRMIHGAVQAALTAERARVAASAASAADQTAMLSKALATSKPAAHVAMEE